MMIYPAIDLKDGQCVRLVEGRADQKTVYSSQPAQVALDFQATGARYLHIVDLDGAFRGIPQNGAAIQAIAAAIDIPFQVGGGLRSLEDVKRTLALGAERVIIGTRAVTSPDFVKELLASFGPDQILLGLDARDGKVAVQGWVEVSSLEAVEFGRYMYSLGIRTAVYTDISRDGRLSGPNIEAVKTMLEKTGLRIIASGGVTTLDNIRELKALEPAGIDGAIVGKALYDGKMDLSKALALAAETQKGED
ncbi:MAG: 1-(5-phosphoribosyl)-5-[(5-phosphoribosylamino)methylideneamino]imidazole-4-carboxamide isomerase [Syntrophomonadaceae bacterium]